MTLLFSNFQRYTPHFPNPKNRSKRGPTVLPFIFQGSVPLPAFSIQNLKKAMKMTWLHMEFVLIFITSPSRAKLGKTAWQQLLTLASMTSDNFSKGEFISEFVKEWHARFVKNMADSPHLILSLTLIHMIFGWLHINSSSFKWCQDDFL